MLGLQLGCRELNPAFQRTRDGEAPSSPSSLVDDSTVQETNIRTPADQTSNTGESVSTSPPDVTEAAPNSATASSTLSQGGSTEMPPTPKPALCGDEHVLCFSMRSNQHGNVVEEQTQALQFVHSNTTVTEPDPNLDAPWDQLLKVSNYGDFASTAAEFSIAADGVLGVEVVAKDLSCRAEPGFCPILAIRGYLSINYGSDGFMECEARHQGEGSPAPSKIRVKLEAPVSPLRAVCWSDGASLMFWANGKFERLPDARGLLPTAEPTSLVIGGEPNQVGYSSIQGSLALVRFWAKVDNLKARLDADPEV